ncbi:MAG: hypothetical protein QHJ73_03000, partial [Armatimonadota bacterium]|nr:hypothetical protein [Armatimonadota bacterium]
MPRRLAITAPHRVEVIEYHDRPLRPNEVLVCTEIASGKHGTTLAMMEGVNFRGQVFDQETRLFLESGPLADTPPPAVRNTGTTGVGTVVETGAAVRRWKRGDRVFGFMDVRETNICAEERLWALGEIHP